MSNEIVECIACGRTFTWSEGEQRFYKERGLDQPKRCRECRAQRNGDQRMGMHGLNTRFPQVTPRPSTPRRESRDTRHHSKAHWMTLRVFRFGAAVVTSAIILAVVIGGTFSLDAVSSWLLSINLLTLLIYGYDKIIAGSGHVRVPEKILLGLAMVGGTVGAIAGMRLFHHKTAKVEFQRYFLAIVLVQGLLITILYLRMIGQ